MRGRIYLRSTLQEREIGDEWVKDSRLQGPEEACNGVRDNAHSTTATHDLRHRLAGQLLRTRIEGRTNSLSEDLQRPNLDQCQHLMERRFDSPHNLLLSELLSRHGITHKGGREAISEGEEDASN